MERRFKKVDSQNWKDGRTWLSKEENVKTADVAKEGPVVICEHSCSGQRIWHYWMELDLVLFELLLLLDMQGGDQGAWTLPAGWKNNNHAWCSWGDWHQGQGWMWLPGAHLDSALESLPSYRFAWVWTMAGYTGWVLVMFWYFWCFRDETNDSYSWHEYI